MKQCFKCKELKPLEEFYIAKTMKDGHLGKCKKCTIQDVKIRAIIKSDKIAEYEKTRSKTEKRKQYAQKHTTECSLKNPEKYHAHTYLNNALRAGRILRASKCEICGKKGNLHAHHTVYSKPLEVIWLCARCHGQIQ